MSSHVTTARGRNLNIDQLIAASKRPMNYEEPASEIAPPAPVKPTALNMRGYMAAQTTESLPENPHPVPTETSTTPVVEGFQRPTDGRSLADLTELRVDQAKSIRVRPGAKVQPGDGTKLAEDTLSRIEGNRPKKTPKGSVMDDLDTATNGAEPAA